MERRLASLDATAHPAVGPHRGPPVLLLHGIGLGRWIFERFQRSLSEAGLASVAVDLPGHGEERGRNPSMDEVLERVGAAVQAMGPCAVVGHSFGGYVAQVVAGRQPVQALVLLAALPHGGVPYWPTRVGVRMGVRYAASALLSHPLYIRYRDYHRSGLCLVSEGRRLDCFHRITAWPGSLVRPLALRPHRVEASAVGAPVLVCAGALDEVVRWEVGRRLGAWFDAEFRRYDALGHLPMLQEEGVALEADITGWLVGQAAAPAPRDLPAPG